MNSIDHDIYNHQISQFIKSNFNNNSEAAEFFGVSVSTMSGFLKDPYSSSHILKIRIMNFIDKSDDYLILSSELYIKKLVSNSIRLINKRFTLINEFISPLKDYCESNNLHDYLLTLEIIHSANLYQISGDIIHLEEVSYELKKCLSRKKTPILIRTVFQALMYLFVKLAYSFQVKENNAYIHRALTTMSSIDNPLDRHSLEQTLDSYQETYGNWIETYLTLNLEDCFTYYNKLGSAYFIGKAYKPALSAFQEATTYIFTSDQELYNLMNQSICQFELGEFDIAFELLNNILADLPEDHYHVNTIYLNAWEMISKKLDPILAAAYFREISFDKYISKGIGAYHITEVLFENFDHVSWTRELSHYFSLIYTSDFNNKLSRKTTNWLINYIRSKIDEIRTNGLLKEIRNVATETEPNCDLKVEVIRIFTEIELLHI